MGSLFIDTGIKRKREDKTLRISNKRIKQWLRNRYSLYSTF